MSALLRPALLLAPLVVAALASLALTCGNHVPLPATPSPPAAGATSLQPAVTAPHLSPAAGEDSQPGILRGVKVVPLRVGPEAQVPRHLALIIETGCWGCDGPTSGLVRVYHRANGGVVTDTLLDPSALGLGPRLVHTGKGLQEDKPYITGFAADPFGAEIVASICARETCGSSGMDSWSPDSRTVIVRSTDGGVTWVKWGELSNGGFVAGLLGPGLALIGTWNEELAARFRTFPALDAVKIPVDGAWPAFVTGGQVYWRAVENRIIDSNGDAFVPQIEPPAHVSDALLAPKDNDWLVGATLEQGDGPPDFYLVPVDQGGAVGQGAFALQGEAVYKAPAFLRVAVDLPNEGTILGNSDFPAVDMQQLYLPAIIDLSNATIRPIKEPFLTQSPHGRNHIVAVQRGPFARVVNTGSCLNVRAEPSTSAEVLECAADGVLLRDTGETQEADGTTWVRAQTPAGVAGWAATAYLER